MTPIVTSPRAVARVSAASFWKRFTGAPFYPGGTFRPTSLRCRAMSPRRLSLLAMRVARRLVAAVRLAAPRRRRRRRHRRASARLLGRSPAQRPESAGRAGACRRRSRRCPGPRHERDRLRQGPDPDALPRRRQPRASAPDRTVKAAFYDLDRRPDQAVATADGAFVWTIEDERGMYVVDVDLPDAGTWGAEFTTAAPGSPAETVAHDVPTSAASLTDDRRSASRPRPRRRRRPPTSAATWRRSRPTRSPIRRSTRPRWPTRSRRTSRSCSIFATPKFCTSAQCGPTLDQFKPIAAAHPEITFINVEPYKLKFDERRAPAGPRCQRASSRRPTSPTSGGCSRSRGSSRSTGTGSCSGSYEVTITPTPSSTRSCRSSAPAAS